MKRKNNIIYCTYFDKYYLIKGLAMYESLKRHNKNVQLWVLCMDDYTYFTLEKLHITGIKLVNLKDFEDDELKKVRKNRNNLEYYWTCTPSLPLFVFNKSKKNCDYVIYVDADLFFYSSNDTILEELGNNSIYIVEHRFPSDQMYRIDKQGRFNVGMLVFKNDSQAVECLKRWRNQCFEWCYFRDENGKMGDQMYLNEWPKLYSHLTISDDIGVGTAPWNVSQYKISTKENSIFINGSQLVFYHFHQFKVLGFENMMFAKGYDLPQEVIDYIYNPYVKEIKKQLLRLKSVDDNFSFFDKTRTEKSLRLSLSNISQRIKMMISGKNRKNEN